MPIMNGCMAQGTDVSRMLGGGAQNGEWTNIETWGVKKPSIADRETDLVAACERIHALSVVR